MSKGKTKTIRIDKCPICAGELQATLEKYATAVVLSDDLDVLDYDEEDSEPDLRIYCENDHTWEEIAEALGKQGVVARSDERTYPW